MEFSSTSYYSIGRYWVYLKIWNFFIATLIVLCCQRIFQAMDVILPPQRSRWVTWSAIATRIIIYLTIMEYQSKNHATQPTSWPFLAAAMGRDGSCYWERTERIEYRNGVGSHGNRSRETTSSLIRLLIGPRIFKLIYLAKFAPWNVVSIISRSFHENRGGRFEEEA